MNIKKNLISALFLQLATVIQGLILPKIIISFLGSEVNGLVGSISQYLSFISLLEGGLGAVVLADLYKPIEDKNTKEICKILKACHEFFVKLAFIFIGYTVFLMCIYPLQIDDFSHKYVATLIIIMSLSTLAQYLFAITNKLLLQAEQRLYVVNFVSSTAIVVNIIASLIVASRYPDIHLLKGISSFSYILQPILFSVFIEKKFRKKSYKRYSFDKNVLSNRWSGFAQNLAHFINMNTDIILVTFFLGLTQASVYIIYMLPINALKQIIGSVTNSYQSAMGKYYASGNELLLKENFDKFNSKINCASIIIFSTCLLLINPFVQIYTAGIEDANYYQPFFAFFIVLANLIYCVREPYRLLILSTGKFKETNLGAILEAIINITLSLILIQSWGLTGVALGTTIAIIYRFIYFIYFLRHNILKINYKSYLKSFIIFILVFCINIYIYFNVNLNISGFFQFIIVGGLIFILESILVAFIDRIVAKYII